MNFEPSVSWGTIIVLIGYVVTIVISWQKFGGRLDMIEFRVKTVEETMKSISETLRSIAETNTKLAVMDQRHLACEESVSVLQKEVYALRRGEGWVTGHRDKVDGEYR